MFKKPNKHELNQIIHLILAGSAVYSLYIDKPISAIVLLLMAIWGELDEINNTYHTKN